MLTKGTFFLAIIYALAAYVLLFLPIMRLHAAERPVVRIYIFSSPECSHCAIIKDGFLPKLAEKVGCAIEHKLFDINQIENYGKLVEMEERWGDTDNEMPVVFIGTDLLAGEKETEERIEEFVRKYAQAGGVGWPEGPAVKKSEPPSAVSPQSRPPKKPEARPVVAIEKAKDISVSPDTRTNRSDSKVDIQTNDTPPQPEPEEQVSTLSDKQESRAVASDQDAKTSSLRPEEPKSVYLGLFYQTSCKECDRIFYLLKYLREKHPFLRVKEFDLAERENKVLYEAIAIRAGVPEKKRLTPATIFIGSDFLLLEDIKHKRLESLISKYRETGSACPWEVTPEELARAEKGIVDRFKTLGPLTVALAGLLDGVNPCAFTTLIFFVSYLMYLGKKGREILVVGCSFAVGVFAAYFLVGCGAFSFLKYITASHGVARVVNMVVAAGAFTLGILSFRDYLKARKGKYGEISLQLPGILKKKIHETVRTRMRTSQHMAAALLAGLTVSVLELACTGQVYLPTIIFVANSQEMRQSALAYLALYNLMFILPLLGVLAITYRGANSKALAEFSKKHTAGTKLATTILFIGLGMLLLII